MVNLKDVLKEIEELFNMKSLVNAYEEIASMKMRKIRGAVLANRDFILELSGMYQEISVNYKNNIINLLNEKNMKDKKRLSIRKSNGKTACVFLSANSSMFGDILHRTYRQFLDYLDTHDVIPVIVGSYGRSLFSHQFPDKKFEYFLMPESGPQAELIREIADKLSNYEDIVIFYGRFLSMTTQNVAMLDVYGYETAKAPHAIPVAAYLFEPSLEKILEFFEQQIFDTIVTQTFTESDLAKYAARMVSLDAATDNIGQRIKQVELAKRLAVHRALNKKQQETLSSLALWDLD